MVFEIDATGSVKDGELLKEYPVLLKYGYHNEHRSWVGRRIGDVVINSPEELVELTKDLHQPIIISLEGDTPTIEIYDDYRE